MSISVIDTLTPLGNFPLANASDIQAGSDRVSDVLNNKVDKADGKGLSTNDYTNAEKSKLSNIEANANNYVHPTTAGNKHIPSGGSAGKILGWAADGTAQWVDNHNTEYNDATTSVHGLMSAADKAKLDNIADNANNYVHPITSGYKHIPSGGSDGKILGWAADGTASWVDEKSTEYIVNASMSQSEIQSIFSKNENKKIYFEPGNYNFDLAFRLNKNTHIDFCGSTLTFSVSHGFYNFLGDDEFLLYNGNGNISIENGYINGGTISFCHANKVSFDNIVFRNMLGNHVIEFAACCNLRITNCDFGGTVESYEPSKFESECIQLDYMNYQSFPWFDDESNPTYDITPNKNVEVAFCKFKAVLPSTLYRCIGSHQYDTATMNTNILIHDNEFYNPLDSAVSMADYDGCYVYNNMFNYTNYPNDYNENAGLITLCDICTNINIYDNHFNGGITAIRGLYPVRSSMTVSIHDNVFENYYYGTPDTYNLILKNIGVILAPNGYVVGIKNNVFKKFNRRCIGGVDNVGSVRTRLATIISGNTFEYSEANTVSTISLFPENMIITENNFVLARNASPSFDSGFRCYVMHLGNYTCKNNFDKYFAYNNLKYAVDAGADMSGNKDASMNLLNQVTSEGTYTLTRSYTEFNTLVVVVGGSTDTNIITLYSYNFPNALDERDYRFTVFSNEGNICTGVIRLHDNDKITINISSSEIKFQKCFGLNNG